MAKVDGSSGVSAKLTALLNPSGSTTGNTDTSNSEHPTHGGSTTFVRGGTGRNTIEDSTLINALKGNTRGHSSPARNNQGNRPGHRDTVARGDGKENKNFHGPQDVDTKFDRGRTKSHETIASLYRQRGVMTKLAGLDNIDVETATAGVDEDIKGAERRLKKANALDLMATMAQTWSPTDPALADVKDRMNTVRWQVVDRNELSSRSVRDAEYSPDENLVRVGQHIVNAVLDEAEASGAIDVDSGVITRPEMLEDSEAWNTLVGAMTLLGHETEHAVQDESGLTEEVQEENAETIAEAEAEAKQADTKQEAQDILVDAQVEVIRNEVSTLEVPAYQEMAQTAYLLDAAPEGKMWNTIDNNGNAIDTQTATDNVIDATMPQFADILNGGGRFGQGGDADGGGRFGQGGDAEGGGRFGQGGDLDGGGRFGQGGDLDGGGRFGQGGDANGGGRFGQGAEFLLAAGYGLGGRFGQGGDLDGGGRFGQGGDLDGGGRFGQGGDLFSGGRFGQGGDLDGGGRFGQGGDLFGGGRFGQGGDLNSF